jgi:hypothetical protein
METLEAIARIRQKTALKWLKFSRRSTPEPTRLYHYTSQDGLIGIISSNTLWASNVLYLNDSSEFAHGIEVARECINTVAKSVSCEATERLLQLAPSLLDLSALTQGREFFACCFCENPDLLSQWRGYADFVGGYAIGLDVNEMRKSVIAQQAALFPLDYGFNGNQELLRSDLELLSDALASCVEQSPEHIEKFVSAALEELELLLQFRVFSLKHPGFAEEREWRVLANFATNDLQNVRFRQGRHTLIPYVALQLGPDGKLPISHVVHGPAANPQLASRSIELLLETYGFSGVSVSGSSIPLRA